MKGKRQSVLNLVTQRVERERKRPRTPTDVADPPKGAAPKESAPITAARDPGALFLRGDNSFYNYYNKPETHSQEDLEVQSEEDPEPQLTEPKKARKKKPMLYFPAPKIRDPVLAATTARNDLGTCQGCDGKCEAVATIVCMYCKDFGLKEHCYCEECMHRHTNGNVCAHEDCNNWGACCWYVNMVRVHKLHGTVEAVPKSYREVRRIMRAAGWRPLRATGRHEIWVDRNGTGRVAVPGSARSGRAMSDGTLASIRRATGIEELR